MLSVEHKPEHEEPKSSNLLRNQKREEINKSPSMQSLDQITSKIAESALIIQPRQRPQNNKLNMSQDKQDIVASSKKGENLGYEINSRRGKSQLDNIPLNQVSKRHQHRNSLEIDIERDMKKHSIGQDRHHPQLYKESISSRNAHSNAQISSGVMKSQSVK